MRVLALTDECAIVCAPALLIQSRESLSRLPAGNTRNYQLQLWQRAMPNELESLQMTDQLLRLRPEFPILEKTTYLISNSLGAMPKAAEDAMREYAADWSSRGVRAWEERWWMLAAEVGDEIGALMNAPCGAISVHQNVTQCQAVIASCLDFSGNRNKVVYDDLNFPSVMYFWEAQRATGA